MRQYAADEAMGLDLSLCVTSLQQSIKVGREERAAGEPVGPAHVHTLSVRHTPRKSPNATPPRRARTAASARAGGAGRAEGAPWMGSPWWTRAVCSCPSWCRVSTSWAKASRTVRWTT